MFAIDIFVPFNDQIMKMIKNNRNKLNNFDSATQRILKTQKRVLKKQLMLIIKRREFLKIKTILKNQRYYNKFKNTFCDV